METNTSNISSTDTAIFEENIENNASSILNTGGGVQRFGAINIAMSIITGAFFVICLWIIILNGLLILCFWINKRENWFSHSKNILSIVIIDLLVGATTLMSFLTSFRVTINRYECLFIMGSCLASQTATSLNVLRFCVTRFYVVSKSSVKREPSTSTVVSQTLIIWLVSVLITIVPLVLWSEKELILQRCAWNFLFPNHQYQVDIYICNLLAIPTLTTTVLYGILSLKLRKVRNFVHPVDQKSCKSGNSNHSWSDTKMTSVQSRNTHLCTQWKRKELASDITCNTSQLHPGNANNLELKSVGDSDLDDSQLKYNQRDKENLRTSSVISKQSIFTTQTCKIYRETDSNQLSVPTRDTTFRAATPCNPKTSPMVNRNNRIGKVRTTIGILLLFINISNLPYIVITALQAYDPAINIPYMIHLFALIFLMLNSACNAVVYAIRLKTLRDAFLGMFRKCGHNVVSNS